MDITNMIYFSTVCKYKNITKAAESLHISQSSLSRRIVSIEDELGVQLLIRSGGYFEITPAGKAFLDEAEEIIKRQAKLIKRIDQFKYDGSLRIGFSQVLYLHPFVDLISEVKRHHPETKIIYIENQIAKNVSALREGSLDIVYATRGEIDGIPDVSFITLAENDLAFLVPKGHRLWNNRSISNEDIKGERICIIKDSVHTTLTASKSSDSLKRLGFQLDTFENVHYCNSTIEVLMYVATFDCLGLSCTLPSAEFSLYPDKIKNIRIDTPHVNYGDLVLAYRTDDTAAENFIKSLL